MIEPLVIAAIAIAGFSIGAVVGAAVTVWIHQRSFDRDPDKWIGILEEYKLLNRRLAAIREDQP